MTAAETPGSHDGEGSIDEDRQDAPLPEKQSTDGDENEGLSGFEATPGDDPEGED